MKHQLLCALEKKSNLKMMRNRDFVKLSEMVYDETHEYISHTTLKRLWGYMNDQACSPSKSTLNILAEYLGYADYALFAQSGG